MAARGKDRSEAVPPHVLLLQGPIGPMFTELEARLEENGARVTRVLFNAGDALFCERRPSTYRFTGEEADWRAWLEELAVRDRPGVTR